MRLQFRLNRLLLVFLLIAAGLISVSSVVNYIEYRKLLINNYVSEHLNSSQRAREYYRLGFDKLQHDFIKKEYENIEVLQRYYDLYRNGNGTLDVSEIARRLNEHVKHGEYQVFLINRSYKVEKASYARDVGFDLGQQKIVADILDSVFSGKADIDASPIIIDSSSMQFKRYLLRSAGDGKYLLQIAYVLNFEEVTNGMALADEDLELAELYLATDNAVQPVKFDRDALEKRSLADTWEQSKIFLLGMMRDLGISGGKISSLIKSDIKSSRVLVNDELAKLFSSDRLVYNFNYDEDRFAVYSITDGLFNKNSETKLILRAYYSTKNLEKDLHSALYVFLLPLLLCLCLLLLVCVMIYRYVVLPLSNIMEDVRKNRCALTEQPRVHEISDLKDCYNALHHSLNSEIEKNAELLRWNRRFLADTVHQIRTPLTNIMMNAEMIKNISNDVALNKYIGMIDSSVNMLSVSYEDLSYINTGDSVEYLPCVIDIAEVLKKRVRFFAVIAEMAHKRFRVHAEDDLYVFVNEIELERIIDNNISNAVKYADAHQPVLISLVSIDGFIVLKFETYGAEIVAKDRVFDEGYREASTLRGLGLGLNMVRGICEKNGIEYSIEYDGGRNVFSYRFSVADD